jgi:hypothetical protein
MAIILNRRMFLIDSAGLMTSIAGLGRARAHSLAGASSEGSKSAQALEQAFLDPPEEAWPWVLWMVSDGNITREGITADLEAMHRVGIRGAVYYEVDLFVPKGPARFLSAQWRELIQHAMKEAARLGITLSAHNDGGYSGSGGPWITPELSMQMLVWSQTVLDGPQTFADTLPQPKTVAKHYRDIAVLAFPTPSGDRVRMSERFPKLSYGLERRSFDATRLIDGTPGAVTLVPRAEKGQPQYLNIDFPESFTAQAMTVALDHWQSELSSTLEVSDDGQHYRTIRSFPLRWPESSVNFPKVSARHYRLLLMAGDEEYNWLDRWASKGFPLGKVELHSGPRIEDIPGKAAYIRQEVFSGEAAIPAEMIIGRDQVVDLSRATDSEGRLHWDVPKGRWTVLRIGHTSTGKTNHPAPAEGLGLECDKLSRKALDVHFAGLMQKLVDDQKAVDGSAFKVAHIDSWEVGSQNWTPGFREAFQKRHGYDLLPYLPVLTGRAVESSEISERFLWDLRRTVNDLFLENYADYFVEVSHQHGLKVSIEGYGSGPFENVTYGARADLPMCEMWTGVPSWQDMLLSTAKEMASSAHVYGHPLLAAEIFTAEPENGKWQNDLFRLKPIADLCFTLGVNHVDCHRYAMQPWLNRKPGMTMGPFGIHYERTNTWWEHSRPWHTYLARCQTILQSSQFVADVAYLGSENAPQSCPKREALDPALPSGYDFDDVPAEVLLTQMTVRQGRLVIPSGMSYRVLVLPPARTMTPMLLAKIKELVTAGATVVGPRPARSPSLANYPQCDVEVNRLGEELWGECDGVSVTENPCGQGKVIWGKTLSTVLSDLGAQPDFACHDLDVAKQIRYIHRTLEGDDLYFVANAVPEARRFLCTFRAQGGHPEFWWPDTGQVEPVTVYDEREAGTLVPMTLDPCGSVFVVFRRNAASPSPRVVSVRRNGVEISGLAISGFGLPLVPEIQLQQEHGLITVKSTATGYEIEISRPGSYEVRTASGRAFSASLGGLPEPMEIEGPWQLEFPQGWGAPERVTLEQLISWTDHADPGVRYFSGTATYHKRFELPASMLSSRRRFYLDLGEVRVLAQVGLNGRDLGILWKPPFRVEITEGLRSGANDLAVSVVNLWPNRLIGDEQLPDDCDWVPPSTPRNLTPHTWGPVLDHWPPWLLANKPSPTGRLTFTTWKHWSKNDPLLESGLLGPVRIVSSARLALG